MPTESDKACGLSISDHFRPPRRQKRMPGEDGKLGRGGSVEQVVRPPPVSPPRRPLPPAPNLTPCPASPAAPPPLNLRFSSSSCGSHSHPSIQEAGRFLCVCVGGGGGGGRSAWLRFLRFLLARVLEGQPVSWSPGSSFLSSVKVLLSLQASWSDLAAAVLLLLIGPEDDEMGAQQRDAR
jgi:hypothetical protein